jgi:hypothetical protein
MKVDPCRLDSEKQRGKVLHARPAAVVVIKDLHWGDHFSLGFMLRELDEKDLEFSVERCNVSKKSKISSNQRIILFRECVGAVCPS